MKEWWIGLTKRERLMVGGAGFFVLFCVFYFAMVEPFFGRLERYRQEVPEKRDLLVWMQDKAKEVESLRGGGVIGLRAKPGGSVMVVIDQTAQKQGLSKSLNRIEPEGENGAKVWLEDLASDDLMLWLKLLETKHGIRPTVFSAEPVDRPGHVKARITLVGAGT